jgi:hypothetical protein
MLKENDEIIGEAVSEKLVPGPITTCCIYSYTESSCDLEPALQLRPNPCHRAFLPHPSASSLRLLTIYLHAHLLGRYWDLRNPSIYSNTVFAFYPESARQQHSNSCHRAFVPHPSACCLGLLPILRDSVLSGENVQQLQAVIRQNTALESLVLTWCSLGSTGLAEITPVLYCNTSIKVPDLTSNGLHDSESANVLRELFRRNKTITSLYIGYNAFGRNAAAARSIADGVRSNTTL